MGIDIHGWVEVRPKYYNPSSKVEEFRRWAGVVKADLLFIRNYDAFGCLFGVMNFANFIPLAPERGIPADASPEVEAALAEVADDPHAAISPSWITWAELKAVDWGEEAPHPDWRLHQYERDGDGRLHFKTKAGWSSRLAERMGIDAAEARRTPGILRAGQEWEIDGVVYRAEKLKRKDALSHDWQLLFGMLEALASQYGDDGVRLVVWFDR